MFTSFIPHLRAHRNLCLNAFHSRRYYSLSLKRLEKDIAKGKDKEFKERGYVLLDKIFEPEEMEELKNAVNKIMDTSGAEASRTIFEASNVLDKRHSDDYFLSSGDKIRFFFEKDAFDAEGNLKFPINQCLNKIGHALHDLNPAFEKISYSPVFKRICERFYDFKAPIAVQSMYIFKHARIGGEVSPHTDNTYIRTNPLTTNAIWLALDDAKIDNGCLWGVPGSHKQKTTYFMKKVIDHEEVDENGKKTVIYKSIYDPPTPPTYDTKGAVPIEAAKGSIVLFSGDFVHFSLPNKSVVPRHAYTLHIVEGRNAKWAEDNWLQRGADMPFRLMNSFTPKVA